MKQVEKNKKNQKHTDRDDSKKKVTKVTEYDVIVIGGGAAGLVAAISAARCGAKTLIIEHMDRIGKKILVTGNGKCNYTNKEQGLENYRGDDPAFVLPVFEQFGFQETISFFKELGIYPKSKNGYYYPASEQAASVVEVLRMEISRLWIGLEENCFVQSINRRGNLFQIDTDHGDFLSKKLLFSTGLKASSKAGSDGSAIPYIESFGHHFTDIVPALVQLQGKQPFFKALAGIRAEINANLYINGAYVTSEKGELQLTDYGISGIPIFQLSRFASKALNQGKNVFVMIDFQPELEENDLAFILEERMHRFGERKTANESLVGFFSKKMIDVLLKESKIDPQKKAVLISETEIKNLASIIKAFRVDVIGTKSFEQAQVCAGGVMTTEINPVTMESKIVPGLYFAGEVVDIDGTCGGYNLQWAWSSGFVAGKHMAETVVE